MTDPSPDVIAEPLPVPPAPSRRPRRALWGVLAVLAIGASALVVRASGDDPPPRLPLSLGSNKEAAGAAPTASADMAMRAYVTYVAGKDLPDLGGNGPAYRLPSGVDVVQVRALAKALGLSGDPVHDQQSWRVSDDTHTLEVYEGGGGQWWFSNVPSGAIEPDMAVGIPAPGVSTESTGGCAPDEKTCATPTTLYVPPPPPADLPTKAEARTIALDLLDATGFDTKDAKVTVDGPGDAWYVTVEASLDGRTVSGYAGNVSVGDKGEILSAGGVLNSPERVGSYPTVATRQAIDRLNDQGGAWSAYDTRSASGVAEAGPATTAPADQGNVADTAVPPESAVTTIPSNATDVCTKSADGSETCSGSASSGSGSSGSSTGTSVVPCALTDVPVEPTTSTVDAPLGGGATPTVAPVPVPECASPEPYVPPEPIEVVLTKADEILVAMPSSDGSEDLYLVPGYRFHSADDTTVVDVPALADDALAPVQTTVPTDPVPGAILPDPGGAADGGTQKIDPSVPCTLPAPGPNGEVPAIGCAEPTTPATG